jgi:hypothetical protein
MKHLSRYVHAVLGVLLSVTLPVGLLADTGPFLANGEVAFGSALGRTDPESSVSPVFADQQQIILANGGAVGRAINKAGKAANAVPAKPPPRPNSTYKPKPGEVDPNDLPSPPGTPGYVGARSNAAPNPKSIYGSFPQRKPNVLKNVAKGVGLTVLTGGVIVSGAALTYFGLVGAGIIEPINWEEVSGRSSGNQ